MSNRVNNSLGKKLMLVAAAITLLNAQPPAARPEFEVASLKPSAPDAAGFFIKTLPGGGLQAKNIPLKRLIATAYSVTDYQIFGDVKLLDQKFDLDARAPNPAELGTLRLMLQSLLDERFHLNFHQETRDLPIYSLLLAKSGVNGGPGLIRNPEGDCSIAVTPQDAPPDGSRPPVPCGTVSPGPGRITGRRGRISQLADRLSTMLGRTVVDKTGLEGTYDIALTFAPDPPPGTPTPELSGPSLFTALQEQLGLKLQAGRGPVEVIVVDSADKLSGN
jgi:uncharacterized protein (TIGR03435 family)